MAESINDNACKEVTKIFLAGVSSLGHIHIKEFEIKCFTTIIINDFISSRGDLYCSNHIKITGEIGKNLSDITPTTPSEEREYLSNTPKNLDFNKFYIVCMPNNVIKKDKKCYKILKPNSSIPYNSDSPTTAMIFCNKEGGCEKLNTIKVFLEFSTNCLEIPQITP